MATVIDTLETIVQREVKWHHGSAHQAKTYYFEDTEQKTYLVTIVVDDNYPIRDTPNAQIVVMARIEADFVIIEEDITDRPLDEALQRAGIPRERIIMRYQGEKLPEAIAHIQGDD